MTDTTTFDLGEKDDLIWMYNMPLDRFNRIFVFAYFRVSFGNVYGDSHFINIDSSALEANVKDIKPLLIDGHEDTFKQLAERTDIIVGNADRERMYNQYLTITTEPLRHSFSSFAALKEHFLANADVPQVLKDYIKDVE